MGEIEVTCTGNPTSFEAHSEKPHALNLPLTFLTALVLVLAAATTITAAATVSVGNSAALTAALAQANPGDEIVLENGVYRGTFTLERSGEPTRPITIRAATPRQVIFSETLFTLTRNHGVLSGLIFERSQVTIRGDHNRVGRSVFRRSEPRPKGMNAAVQIAGGGSHNRIHHNELTGWSTYGFRIVQPNKRMTGNRIDHNYLHDYVIDQKSNSPEAIQIGSSNEITHLNLATIIERNLIERVRIRGELLSLKTSGNVVRENTFIDAGSSVQARHGTGNTFLNNTLIHASVLRAYGDRHRLIGNRLVATELIVPSGDVTQDELGKPGGRGHPSARQQLVAGNLLEQGARIIVGQGHGPFAAEDTILAGNSGPVVSEGAELRHSGTKMTPTYDGDAGTPVRLTREQVGPGAPEPMELRTFRTDL